MATINRFTQYQPARYTPRTLQELMVAPAYKRQKHGQLQQNISSLDAALDQYQSLNIDNPKFQAEKERLQQALDSQMEKLNSEGFNQSNVSDFIGFNSKYQQAVGQNGIIGKADAVRQNYIKGLEEAYKAAPDGYSSQDVRNYYNQYFNKYMEDNYDRENIENISIPGMVAYENFEEDYWDLVDKAGSKEIENLINSNTVSIGLVGGIPQLITDNRSITNTSNKDALNSLNKYLMNKYAPGTEARRSLDIQGVTGKDMVNIMKNGFGIALDSSKKINGSLSTKNLPSQYYEKQGPNNPNNPNNSGLTFIADRAVPLSLHNMNYTEMEDELDKLESLKETDGLSIEEQAKYNSLKGYMRQVQAKLTDNKEYNKTLSLYQKAKDDFNKMEKGVYDYSKDYNNYFEGESSEINAKQKSSIRQSKVNAINQYKDKLDNIAENVEFTHKMKVSEFALTPNKKNQKYLDQLNKNINTVFGNNKQALSESGTILSVTNENDDLIQLSNSNTQEEISHLVYNAINDEKSNITVSAVVLEGSSGYPEIVFSVPTKEISTKISNNNLNPFDGNTIGGGNTTKVRVAFDKISNDKVQNIFGLIQNYMKSSGNDGAKFVEAQEINRFYKNSNGRTWKDIGIKTFDDVKKVSPYIQKIIGQKLVNQGITKESSYKEKEEAFKKITTNLISK